MFPKLFSYVVSVMKFRYWLNDVVAARAAWDPIVDLQVALDNSDYQVSFDD